MSEVSRTDVGNEEYEDPHFWTSYYIIQCKGCNLISFMKTQNNSENIIGYGEDIDTRARLFRFKDFERELLRERTSNYPWSVGGWAAYAAYEREILFKHDAFERNALGKTAMLVWQRLSYVRRSMKPSQIAEMCDLNVDQVYRALKKLERFKLAKKLIKTLCCWLREFDGANL